MERKHDIRKDIADDVGIEYEVKPPGETEKRFTIPDMIAIIKYFDRVPYVYMNDVLYAGGLSDCVRQLDEITDLGIELPETSQEWYGFSPEPLDRLRLSVYEYEPVGVPDIHELEAAIKAEQSSIPDDRAHSEAIKVYRRWTNLGVGFELPDLSVQVRWTAYVEK